MHVKKNADKYGINSYRDYKLSIKHLVKNF